jgi:hypothetical protein
MAATPFARTPISASSLLSGLARGEGHDPSVACRRRSHPENQNGPAMRVVPGPFYAALCQVTHMFRAPALMASRIRV